MKTKFKKLLIVPLAVALLLCSCNSKPKNSYYDEMSIEALEDAVDIIDKLLDEDIDASSAKRRLEAIADPLRESDVSCQKIAGLTISSAATRISSKALMNKIDSGESYLKKSDLKEIKELRDKMAEEIK